MSIKTDDAKLVMSRVNRVGYTLYKLSYLYNKTKEVLLDFELESHRIEVYVFDASDYSYYFGKFLVNQDDTPAIFYKKVLSNIKQLKVYNSDKIWGNKLYEYAKLNNYVNTFVSVCDNVEYFNEREYR